MAVSASDYIWGYAGTSVTFSPDSGSPDQTCDIWSSSNSNLHGNSVVGTMALIAMKYDAQFDSVNVSCGNSGSGYFFEMGLNKGGNQIYVLYSNTGGATAFVSYNGTNCLTSTGAQADKIALMMATNQPMTVTCTYNSFVNDYTLDVVF